MTTVLRPPWGEIRTRDHRRAFATLELLADVLAFAVAAEAEIKRLKDGATTLSTTEARR